MRLGTYNVNFASDPDQVNRDLDRLAPMVDALLMQETKNVRVHRLLPPGYQAFQRVSGEPGERNAAVAWRKEITDVGRDLTVGVFPQGHRLLTRYITSVDLDVDGVMIRLASIHRPPPRMSTLWDDFDDNLAQFIADSPFPVIVGGDFNDRTMGRFARRTGTRWYVEGIDGFLVDRSIKVTSIERGPRLHSDHRPTLIEVDLPSKPERGDAVRVATYNMRHKAERHHAKEVAADAATVAAEADLIGWQEAHDWLGILEALPGFKTLSYGPHSASNLPISYRPDVLTLRRSQRIFVGSNRIEADPNPHYVILAEFTHRETGQPIVVLNNHLNSHIEGAGHPYDLPRTRHAFEHIAHLRALIEKYRDQATVIVLGDFNIDHPADRKVQAKGFPVDVLGPLVEFDMPPHADTHGRRDIDYVLHTPSPSVRVTRSRVIEGLSSDHDPVVVDFALDQPAEEADMPTGFMPGAVVKNIAPGANDPRILPVGVIYHVAVSHADSLHDYFDGPSGGIESHFYVRTDGTIEQYRSIFYEADANYRGNSFLRGGARFGFVSIETEGMGEGEWTPAQMASLKRITCWVHSQSKFPLRVSPAWNEAGIGYHSMFPEQWTPYAGKTCPGPERIAQFNDDIVPWLCAGMKEDDMAYLDWPQKDREALVADVATHAALELAKVNVGTTKEPLSVRNAFRALIADDLADDLAEKVAAKVNASVNADAEVVKQAVKDALREGLNPEE